MPLVGEICSQLPPDSVLAVAVQLSDPWPMFRMPKLPGKGTPPCATALKLKPLCETRMTAVGALTDNVTATLTVLPAPVIVMVPL